MKTRSLTYIGIALCSLAVLLAMPWLAQAHQPAQAPPVWQIRTLDGDGVGLYTSLALDANGYPHISYYDQDDKNLKYAHWTGSAWATQTVHAGEDLGLYTSLALDSRGQPHISYYDRAFDDLWYASWTGSSWDLQRLDDNNFAGWDPSLALDKDDHPQIAYFAREDVLHMRWTGSEWRVRRVDGAAQGVGVGISLAVDGNGHPHISYCDYSNRDLKYARWTGSDWDVQRVDRSGQVGYYTSLALDADDRPHIGYYDETNDRLKYAYWTGSAWQIEAVDSEGGTDASLALDAQGRPHISYYDHANRALKHATKYAQPGLRSSVKAVDPSLAQGGETVTYTLRVVNLGDLYQNVSFSLRDPIPPNTTYVPGSVQANGGTIDDADGITWSGALSGTQSLVATFAVNINPALTQPTAIVNTALLTGDPAGPLTLSATVIVDPLRTFLPLVARSK